MSHKPQACRTAFLPPSELPVTALDHVAGGVSPIEFGEHVAAFVLAHMFS
jgi:hypothetical protein